MALSVEKKVGMFFLIGLIVLGILLEVGEKWNPFEKNVPYKTFLTSITGLKVGDPVRLAGVDVGRITKISILSDKIQIDFEVKPGTQVHTDTVAGLRLTNLLGGQFLGLSFGTPSAPLLQPGSTVTGKDVANIDIIVDNVSDLTKDAKAFITSLNKNQDDVLKKISAMLEENRGNLKGTVANLNSITAKLDRGDGSLALLLNDKKLYSDTSATMANLNAVTAKIQRGEGTIGKLVNDDAFYKDATAVVADLKTGVKDLNAGMKNVNEITAKINRGEGTIGKLVNDDTMYNRLNDASKDIGEIARKVNSGQGTIGKLINEDNLYRDTTATLKKAERAMEGLGDTGPISVLGSIIGTLF
ncbi:ABC transporter substrate-binding protein [Geomonas limicola]|uniref:ABC transporter substrate-binding protein n=1 Tax=Geomonas limicola TaxID=2740186 RepID=A0A6V8N842_9BACT|nr:MlaD family protein [Geomonas limicola]GFO67937.1 ABC transporter substrate-binding protein [Geomonas limicola]